MCIVYVCLCARKQAKTPELGKVTFPDYLTPKEVKRSQHKEADFLGGGPGTKLPGIFPLGIQGAISG